MACLNNLHRGYKVLYVSLELDQDRVAERFDAQLADMARIHGVTINNLLEKEQVVKEGLNQYVDEELHGDKRRLIIKQFPSGRMDVAAFRAYFNQLDLNGFRPDLVIIDYIGEMRDYPGMPTWESRYMIVRDLRGFAIEENVGMLVAMQPGKSGAEVVKNGSVLDDENLADAYGQVRPLDAFWTINQMAVEKAIGIARIYLAKHRNGRDKIWFPVSIDKDILAIKEISRGAYEFLKREAENKEEKSAGEVALEEEKAKAIWKKNKKNDTKSADTIIKDAGHHLDNLEEQESLKRLSSDVCGESGSKLPSKEECGE